MGRVAAPPLHQAPAYYPARWDACKCGASIVWAWTGPSARTLRALDATLVDQHDLFTVTFQEHRCV